MADTRFIYFYADSGQVYSNHPKLGTFLLGYDFDDLNGTLKNSGVTSGINTLNDILLYEPRDLSITVYFKTRKARSEFIPIAESIDKVGYSDKLSEDVDGNPIVYKITASLTSYENIENPYIDGYEQHLKFSVTGLWESSQVKQQDASEYVDNGTKWYVTDTGKGEAFPNVDHTYIYNDLNHSELKYGVVLRKSHSIEREPGDLYEVTVPSGTTRIEFMHNGQALIVVDGGRTNLDAVILYTDFRYMSTDGHIYNLNNLGVVSGGTIANINTIMNSDIDIVFSNSSGTEMSYQYKIIKKHNFI